MYFMNTPTGANFSALTAAGMSSLGGTLYGGVYTGVNNALRPGERNDSDLIKELIANSAGGAVSGLGIYGASQIPEIVKRLERLKK